MKKFFVVLAILFIGILLAGCTTQPTPTPTPTATPTPVPTAVPTTPQIKGCYAIIAEDPQFSVLASALRAAKLDATLDGPGPFTILAPTDNAFAQLPNDTIPTLLKDPEGQLKQVLLNHVIANKTLMKVDITKVTVGEATTMEGTVLVINTTDGVTIGGAKVTKTDIVCSGGVIHVVDRVIIPPVAVPTPTPTPKPTPQPSVTFTFTQYGTITPGTTILVPVGGKVIFVNDDPYKPHGIIAQSVETGRYFGGENPLTIAYGKPLEVTFDKAGTYDYQTVYQPSLTGKIIVTK
jgi:uncharacterized surface protein with fasciclin (FAS1) repeats